MQDDQTNDPVNYHDDNRVMRYLLHTVKGISPVSGGMFGDSLDENYQETGDAVQVADDVDLDPDAVA